MADPFVTIPLDRAIPALSLDAHFEGRSTLAPYAADFAGGAPGTMAVVRHYPRSAAVTGDLDMDGLAIGHNVAGIVVDGDLRLEGSILNWEIDGVAAFLWVRGNLRCRNIVFGCMDLVVNRNVAASGLIVATYNHGHLLIAGDVRAGRVIIDDDGAAIIDGKVTARGWCASNNAQVALRKSGWRNEVRPEFRDEFFRPDGLFRCGSGNVDLVQALLAGRDILRPEPAVS
jgi:hypothetical protein